MSTAEAARQTPTAEAQQGANTLRKGRPLTPRRLALHVVLGATALIWFFPLLWALLNSFRDYSDTATHGYASLGGFTLDNYTNAWARGNFTRTFVN